MKMFSIPVQCKSLHDIIVWVEQLFQKNNLYFGHGTDNALDEAAWLIAYCADKPVDFTDNDLGYVLTPEQREKVTAVLHQRIIDKQPAAYITGTAYFFGLEFTVNEHVLIPRSPVAELIAEHFSPWFDYTGWLNKSSQSETNKPLAILDMCTGSGCIAIACATVFKNANVDAVDISEPALQVANINIKKHNLTSRVNAICSDMFEALPQKRYDIIVSNPPYVTQSEIDQLPDEYHKEPESGLFAANKGLQFAITILQQAFYYLADDGIVVIEVGNSAQTLQQYFPDIPVTWLEFESGGDGVFVLDATQIRQYHAQFKNINNMAGDL